MRCVKPSGQCLLCVKVSISSRQEARPGQLLLNDPEEWRCLGYFRLRGGQGSSPEHSQVGEGETQQMRSGGGLGVGLDFGCERSPAGREAGGRARGGRLWGGSDVGVAR